jgi:hypothetical protein
VWNSHQGQFEICGLWYSKEYVCHYCLSVNTRSPVTYVNGQRHSSVRLRTASLYGFCLIRLRRLALMQGRTSVVSEQCTEEMHDPKSEEAKESWVTRSFIKVDSHLSVTCQFRISDVSVPYQCRVSSVSVPCQFRISSVSVPCQFPISDV